MGDLLAAIPVVGAGIYLLALGAAAFLRPDRVTTYLGRHASTLRAHLLELALRIGVGGGFVVVAPGTRLPIAFRVLGWVLIATSGVLLMVPWQWHRRFAQWSVPQATARLPLLGAAALAGGAFLLWAR